MTTSAPTPEPCGLSAEEEHAWRSYTASTQLVSYALDRRLQRDAGMSHLYYHLLLILSEAPGRRLRMGELAQRLNITRTRLSHAVSRLEEQGWVARETVADELRGRLAVLTDDGVRTIADAAPGYTAQIRAAVFDRLTPEQVTSLAEIFDIIGQGLPPAHGSHPPADLARRGPEVGTRDR
ncbi:MarR family winged helix-turn-helix transcriptional regulator [Streptomyces sp. GQFP]|uniref:MarR family winged helix-turn-helix transcriptional regulator n=1 Tax=Streptomyces sp. GQFP TaxID=2907545 RepID=UPI001F2DA478|nr:MarR family transcriptional regulator [Streptomyces sp. GQFP]UIX31950.1 MarR family transcriptional regulator [Streptomyces sp. GQFP]